LFSSSLNINHFKNVSHAEHIITRCTFYVSYPLQLSQTRSPGLSPFKSREYKLAQNMDTAVTETKKKVWMIYVS